MQIKYIKQEDTKTTKWAKGSTSEYYIYPESCNYMNKDFLFRISSATIDEQPARFTMFIGYTRYLTMLDSALDISINRKQNTYENHEIIKFHSEDDTIAYSTGKDFNLMVKEDIKDHCVEVKHGFFTFDNSFVIAYALNDCEAFVNSETYPLKKNECLVIENLDKKEFDFISPDDLIIAQLNLIHDGLF
ncbi:environmental stress-induced protein Ves [Bacilli bacterium PM5-3]|nr:environmental stress-induced protein Ves [Bacilli bacterium PM5-3]MDH6603918.1 environmental stress-induced protein Ves [Bacilli bacterium PM5-9]